MPDPTTAGPQDARSRGAGTEGRDWVTQARPARLRPEHYETTEHEERIVVRDGTSLSAVIIEPVLPAGSPPQPCVVVTNGYSGLDFWLQPGLHELASHGYPVVLARLRGVPPSEGRGGLYEHYGEDGYDVIEWAAAQPFCNGRVGMVGASLLGISQWLAAKEQPPHLTVVVPDDAPADTYHYLWYLGGMPPGPGRQARREVPGVESEYDQAISEPWFGEFWRQRVMTRADLEVLARSGLPALTSTGWDSYLVDAGLAVVYLAAWRGRGVARPAGDRAMAARGRVLRRPGPGLRHRARNLDPALHRRRAATAVAGSLAAR